MSKLTPLDAAFLVVETQATPAHVAMLQIFQLPPGKGSAWLAAMMEELRRHRPGPPFNLRLKTSRFGLPEMVEDEYFDIDYHLRHTVLPRPGDEEQLCNVVARLHANLLDRDRPLWEFHLIEGLENRRFAFYTKIQHAICDGATFSKWVAESTSTAPTGTPMRPVWQRAQPEPHRPERPWLESLQEAQGNLLRNARNLSLGLAQLGARLLRARYLEGDRNIALPLSSPRTAINTHLTAARRLAFTSLPLDALKAIGRPFEGTINDVVLAICDIAVRRYLDTHDGAPGKPLVAAVPVNLRPPGSTAEGNLVTSLQVKLGNPDEDPVSRLQTVMASIRATRALYEDVPSVASQAYTLVAGSVGALGSALGLEVVIPPPLNVIISNVPGPRETRYFNGARLLETYPVSGIVPMTTLNLTVYSYDGRLYFGLVSARRTVPDLQRLRDYIVAAFEELQAAIAAQVESVAPESARRGAGRGAGPARGRGKVNPGKRRSRRRAA